LARYAATRELLAPVEDVWAFVADPHNLAKWWPGVAGVEPDRRGLAPGARWQLRARAEMSFLPPAAGTILVVEVRAPEYVHLQFVQDRLDAELHLTPVGDGRTRVGLVVEAPFFSGRRGVPRRALARLYALVQTGADV
jgi:uncharacterized protein YndB with AHSA1/START domain